MPTYIQLLTLNGEGQLLAVNDPESILRAHEEVGDRDIQILGTYGVLGPYDFVNLVQAKDNDSVARFSLELGSRAGAQITTMPAIPITRLKPTETRERSTVQEGRSLPLDDGGIEATEPS